MKKWRNSARIIDIDVHTDEYGNKCFGGMVVFGGWNWRLAVWVPSLPPEMGDTTIPRKCTDEDLEQRRKRLEKLLPFRSYAMICSGTENWEDLEPEWCD